MLGPDPNKELLKDSTRLAAFLQECLALGSLRGFCHFETFMRGREELVLCVCTDGYTPNKTVLAPTDILQKHYSPGKLRQWSLPTPLNPSDQALRREKNRIVFLVAGYAKYRCPYVWLRSHHEQLIRAQPGQSGEDDNPLQLKKTSEWKTQNVALWEMVAEILQMTSNPSNPFKVDFDYIQHLPLEEAVLLAGSLLSFLENVWIQMEPACEKVADEVYSDIQLLQSKYIDSLYAQNLKHA